MKFGRSTTAWALVSSVIASTAASTMVAQGSDTTSVVASPVPRVVASAERVRVLGTAGVRLAVLDKTIAVDLDDVPLGAALLAIARQAGLRLTYRESQVVHAHAVSLHATSVTVEGALLLALHGTGLDAALWPTGELALIAHSEVPPVRRQGGGTVAGQAIDAVTRTPLNLVAVHVEGPGLGAVSGSDGRYTIHNVPPGTYRVTARRVGYTPLTRVVVVATDSTAAADFALAAAPTRLTEMVTTAVGNQRRYEVGNTISTINADSIAPTAPITSLTDLVSARAPGVEVLENGGMTGSGETIRIRGVSSLVLQNDPIVIVDGVRQDNSAGGDIGAIFQLPQKHPTPTRLNDINFSDIETIDILKGPSASTEYGTDAANGVIVITTKHGTVGRPRWQVSAEQTTSEIPERFPNGYYSWGHTTDASHTPVNCPLVPGVSLTGVTQASTTGTCVVDSVTQWSPLNHAATSVFGTGARGRYDLSVGGGSDAMRYFIAGGLSNETGIVRLPTVFRQAADTAHLGLPASTFRPNTEQQRSVRANAAIRLAPTVDVTATGSYLSTDQQTPNAAFLYTAAIESPALRDPAHYYGYDWIFGPAYENPISELTATGSEQTSRAIGGLTANWRPVGWFVGHATVGVDHGSQRSEQLNYPLVNATYMGTGGAFLGLADATTDLYSVDLRGTATSQITRGVRSVTSGGVQMVDTRTRGQTATNTHITPTNLTLNGAVGSIVTQQANRQATLGGYGEEEISLADRLFLTGALRIDAGSGFGRAYATAAYPKASASWLAIDQGSTTIRLRGAWGIAGVQPTNGSALALYAPGVSYVAGSAVTVYQLSWPGNPHLRPERTAELEGGVDITGWSNRVTVELSGYSKTTHDALVNLNLGQTVGNYTYQENVGQVRNSGLEGSVTAGIVRQRSTSWDITVTGSINHNKLISLAPGAADQLVLNYAQERQAPGYPLYGYWGQRVTYADANHDGIIEANEITLADSATFVGPNLPTREASASTHLGLWRGALTVGGLVDYRGGYRIANINPLQEVVDGGNNLREQNDARAPLWLQARAVAAAAQSYPAPAPFIEDGTFMRVREVSLTYAVPPTVAHAARVQSLSVTGAVRNLALWTRYHGVDPEITNTYGANIQTSPTSNTGFTNNNVRTDFGAVPLARYWIVRLNVGL